MERLRALLTYLLSLGRPKLRLERSPERLLMPFILGALTILAVFACLLPLKIAAGGAYEARGVDGQLVVHLAQGQQDPDDFQGKVRGLVNAIEAQESIARVSVATGPDLAKAMTVLFGNVSSQDVLYGGIVRLDLVEAVGQDANIENLQLLVSGFESANVDDFRQWKEASRTRTQQALYGGLFVLVFIFALVAATLNLTIRLALRMHQRTLRVIHHLGATDGFGAMLFQATTFRRAALGALIGAGISLVLVWLLGRFLIAQGFPGAAQISLWQGVAMIAVPTLLVAFAVFVARQTARQFLIRTY